MWWRRTILIVLLVALVGPSVVVAETDAERRERIEQQLKVLTRQMYEQQTRVEEKQLERQTLERDLSLIDAEIGQAQLGIEARSAAISNLGIQIEDKAEAIEILNERLAKQRASLAELIRQTQSYDDYSMVEVLLSNQNLSEFFTDADRFTEVKESLNGSVAALKQIREDTAEQKYSLEEKQMSEEEMRQIQELEKQRIEAREAEKERILEVTKGEEAAYQELLESQQKSVAQLKAELFTLLGGGGQIPLPEAIALAQVAEGLTGTPAALILAILEQETNLGSNLGSCVMADTSAGRDIMHPDRDKPPFLAIAAELGFDPTSQPVSCPLRDSAGNRIGWGGAMGPSQFIPSTWAIYGGFVKTGTTYRYDRTQDAIRSLLRKSTPGNPFENQDAFLATALLLRDNGANGTYSADRMAALRYYAGWGGATRPENAFYGDGVMQRKARLAREMQILAGS